MKRATNLALIHWHARLRAVSKTGGAWAGAWALVSVIPAMITWIVDPAPESLGLYFAVFASFFSLSGGICGIAFGVLLMVAADNSSIDGLSIPRAASLGALTGGIVAILGALSLGTQDMPRGAMWVAVITGAVLSGASAAVTLRVARRGLIKTKVQVHELPVA